jgi:hypothetical protein
MPEAMGERGAVDTGLDSLVTLLRFHGIAA